MRFAIVDVANLFFRAQHVTRGDAFTKAGMALMIVFRSLRKLHREFKVDHMVFATEGHSWRYEVYPKYKAKRKLERQALTPREREESEVFLHVLDSFIGFLSDKTRCTVLQSPGVEGDDFVARWVQLHPDDEHVILSGDSDFVQLLADNVSIVDGVNERVITTTSVTDFKGRRLEFAVDPSKGKLKVGEPAASDWRPEPEWWRKALFIKVIRGDDGDGIFSAYPGVRYEGTTKKTGIREAWEDRDVGGYHWNNFMLQRWEKLIGKDGDGNAIKEEVRVFDEYKFNEGLIDLTLQPQRIKDLMDTVIIQAVQKEPVGNVGIQFLRFCNEQNLPSLTREANDHAAYLNSPYSK
jgi:hypothetical protein